MKILHIGVMVNHKNIGLSKQLRELATEYDEYRPDENIPIKEYDLIFLQVQSETIGKQNTITKLKPIVEKGKFVINWTGDIRKSTPKWMIDFAPYVNVTCFSNMRDVNYIRGRGFKSEFLQIGIDTDTFNYKRDSPNGHDIVFMGNDYGNTFPLSADRRQMVSFLQREYGDRFGCYGNYKGSIRQLNPDPNNPYPIQKEESDIYTNSKIAISMSHFNEDRYFSDRLLRAMGSNCMVLSHDYEGLSKDFTVNGNIGYFTNMHSLRQLIDIYLNNEIDRDIITKKGYELVHTKHTYKNMAENIIKLAQ